MNESYEKCSPVTHLFYISFCFEIHHLISMCWIILIGYQMINEPHITIKLSWSLSHTLFYIAEFHLTIFCSRCIHLYSWVSLAFSFHVLSLFCFGISKCHVSPFISLLNENIYCGASAPLSLLCFRGGGGLGITCLF